VDHSCAQTPLLFVKSDGQSEPKTLNMVVLLQDQSKVRWMGVVTLTLSTLSVTFLFLFLRLFHIYAVRYMWLHCWPPTSAFQLMYRYCGLEAFTYVMKQIVPIVQNISFQPALKLFILHYVP
jgi:hypothetical protein